MDKRLLLAKQYICTIMFCVMSLCFGKKAKLKPIFIDFFPYQIFFKNVMEYALPEAVLSLAKDRSEVGMCMEWGYSF